MNALKLRSFPVYSPDDASGGAATDTAPTAEQLQQQLQLITSKYTALQAKVAEGKLVDPDALIKSKVEAGELFHKERYVGLQQTLQKEKDTLTGLQASSIELQEKLSKLEEEKNKLASEKATRESEVTTLKHAKARAQLIFEKFPDLAVFEANGLLPDGDEGKLEEIFGKFSEKLGAATGEAKKQFAAGGGVKAPPSEQQTTPAATSASAHLRLANEALAAGNRVLYDQEYDEYLKLLANS